MIHFLVNLINLQLTDEFDFNLKKKHLFDLNLIMKIGLKVNFHLNLIEKLIDLNLMIHFLVNLINLQLTDEFDFNLKKKHLFDLNLIMKIGLKVNFHLNLIEKLIDLNLMIHFLDNFHANLINLQLTDEFD